MTALLEVRSLNKSFGGIKATDDLNLAVEKGELHAIIGPNGAGKTTMISQLCGTLRPDSGHILFRDRDITAVSAHRRARLGITRSFQITSLIMDMTVIDNIALALQARDGHSFRFVRPARSIRHLRDRAMELLAQVGLTDKAEFSTSALSHGEHRHMEIAISLASEADLMLLDEPMAGLGTEESAAMVTLLKGIKGKHTILLIEHDMDAVFALADRISVLVYGHIIATGPPDEIRANEAVQHAYLGEEQAMLEVKELTTHYGSSQALFGVDLKLDAGQVATLLGRNGMGKTTTINSIMGIVPASGGSILFEGQELVGRKSFRIANLGLGLVPEGRQIFPNLSLRENLVATASNHLGVDDPWTEERIFALFPELEARRSSMGNLLSGGEQQMLAIGRALMTNPKLLILDEATEGLAPLVRQKIWTAISEIRKQGMSILVVDKNLADLMRIADRHFVIQRGQVVWTGDSDDLEKDTAARETYLGL